MIKLSTFGIGQRIVSADGFATPPFLRWINDTVKSIQTSVNDLSSLVGQIVEALEQAGIAVQLANEAKDAVTAAAREPALVNSYVVETGVLTSTIDPASTTKAVIAIAAHTRMYGDGTSKPVNAGSIAGLDLETAYYITYNDPTRTGGAVVYSASTTPGAGQTGDRHVVGGYTTPAAGGTGGGGGTTQPPGIPPWKFRDRELEAEQ